MDLTRDRQDADARYMKLLKEIVLREVPTTYAVFLFGSRARGEKKRAPDADIGILGTELLPLEKKRKLMHAIEESIIPFKVDIIDFYRVDPEFKQCAMEDIDIWRSLPGINLG